MFKYTAVQQHSRRMLFDVFTRLDIHFDVFGMQGHKNDLKMLAYVHMGIEHRVKHLQVGEERSNHVSH